MAKKKTRFHGGVLDDSEQDRWLADWIEKTPNAWSVIKYILWTWHNGGMIQVPSNTSNETINDDREQSKAEASFLAFDD